MNNTTVNPSANGPEVLARYCDTMLKRSAGKKDAASSAAGASSKAGARRRLAHGADDGDPTETLTRMVRVVDHDIVRKVWLCTTLTSFLTVSFNRSLYSNTLTIKTCSKSSMPASWLSGLSMQHPSQKKLRRP